MCQKKKSRWITVTQRKGRPEEPSLGPQKKGNHTKKKKTLRELCANVSKKSPPHQPLNGLVKKRARPETKRKRKGGIMGSTRVFFAGKRPSKSLQERKNKGKMKRLKFKEMGEGGHGQFPQNRGSAPDFPISFVRNVDEGMKRNSLSNLKKKNHPKKGRKGPKDVPGPQTGVPPAPLVRLRGKCFKTSTGGRGCSTWRGASGERRVQKKGSWGVGRLYQRTEKLPTASFLRSKGEDLWVSIKAQCQRKGLGLRMARLKGQMTPLNFDENALGLSID